MARDPVPPGPHVYDTGTTIAAVATPPGEGGIAVVRVSGAEADRVARAVLRSARGGAIELSPRSVRLGEAVDPMSGRVLDEVLAVWMPGPRSYTREDVLEIQCHGGHSAARAVLAAVLGAGARLAEPGEFTLRAFLGGRIDLVQAEAVLDVIRARGEEALRAHEALMGGGLSEEVAGWQQALERALVSLELQLDFGEEEVEACGTASLAEELGALAESMAAKLGSAAWGQTCREGFRVAIVGAPNTGKSSFLNRALEEDRAIVSDRPGTTRDVVEGWLVVDGVPILLVDTAGLRATTDPVEMEGVRRARQAADRADLVVFMCDGSRALEVEEARMAAELARCARVVAVVNKVDLGRTPAEAVVEIFGTTPVEVCAVTGEGVGEVLAAVRSVAVEGRDAQAEAPLTRERHRRSVEGALECVRRAREGVVGGEFPELVASELHGARAMLGSLLGWGTPEDVLESIFREFCIGK